MMAVIRVNEKAPLRTLIDLTEMMMAYKRETEPDAASDDESAYVSFIKFKIRTAFVYHMPETGFCIIDVAFDPLASCSHRSFFVMSHIFIVPEKRKTRAYAELFYASIKNHPGKMIGFTYSESDHNAIMTKRYRKIGTIYGREYGD